MTSALAVEISRKILRTLQLGKGMFFDREAMEELAAAGIWDHVHQAAAEYQKEEAIRRRSEREEAQPSRESRPGPALADSNDDVEEAFARARRALRRRR